MSCLPTQALRSLPSLSQVTRNSNSQNPYPKPQIALYMLGLTHALTRLHSHAYIHTLTFTRLHSHTHPLTFTRTHTLTLADLVLGTTVAFCGGGGGGGRGGMKFSNLEEVCACLGDRGGGFITILIFIMITPIPPPLGLPVLLAPTLLLLPPPQARNSRSFHTAALCFSSSSCCCCC